MSEVCDEYTTMHEPKTNLKLISKTYFDSVINDTCDKVPWFFVTSSLQHNCTKMQQPQNNTQNHIIYIIVNMASVTSLINYIISRFHHQFS